MRIVWLAQVSFIRAVNTFCDGIVQNWFDTEVGTELLNRRVRSFCQYSIMYIFLYFMLGDFESLQWCYVDLLNYVHSIGFPLLILLLKVFINLTDWLAILLIILNSIYRSSIFNSTSPLTSVVGRMLVYPWELRHNQITNLVLWSWADLTCRVVLMVM